MLNVGLALSPFFSWYRVHVISQLYAQTLMLELIFFPLPGWPDCAAMAATLILLHVRLAMSEVDAKYSQYGL